MANITEKTKAIVIQSIRYGDSSLIVKMFTKEYGMQSYMVKGVFGRKSKFKPALFQNMTILDIVASPSKSSLSFIKEISLSHYYKTIPLDIKKSSVVLFVSELLSKSIPESEPDEALFDFIHHALTWLDDAESGYADFHLVFAIRLCHYLGFHPNIESYRENYHFDIYEGKFIQNHNDLYTVDSDISRDLYHICCHDIGNTSLNICNKKRRQLLDIVVSYYKLHVDSIRKIQSCDILHEVFSL